MRTAAVLLPLVVALAVPAAGSASGSHIIVLRAGEPAAVANEHARLAGARITHVYRHALGGYSAELSDTGLGLVRLDPRVHFVSADGEVFLQGSQPVPTGINRIDADQSSTRAGDGTGEVPVNVAVIDSGIAPHSDLNVVGGTSCVPGESSYGDGHGHGTHVAGTIGARDNETAVVGVAPGARLWSLRVFDSTGAGTWSNVICAVDWLTANASLLRIGVANMSLGGFGSDDGNCGLTNFDAVHQAICNSVAAGVTYVAAAGNNGSNFGKFIPATYEEVLAATAIADYDGRPEGKRKATCYPDTDDTAADFSNYAVSEADQAHTVAAPGVCIVSTSLSGGTTTKSGTSMAAPHVAGVAALCLWVGRCAGTPVEIRTRLLADAQAANVADTRYGFGGDPLRPVTGRYYGYLIRASGY